MSLANDVTCKITEYKTILHINGSINVKNISEIVEPNSEHYYTDSELVTGVEVTIGNCFPDVWKILPDAKGGG